MHIFSNADILKCRYAGCPELNAQAQPDWDLAVFVQNLSLDEQHRPCIALCTNPELEYAGCDARHLASSHNLSLCERRLCGGDDNNYIGNENSCNWTKYTSGNVRS